MVIFLLQVYSVTDERKEDQVSVDKQIMSVIRANADKKYLISYLKAPFALGKSQYPHNMIF